MNQEKFMERLTESKARGAARRAERDTPEKKTQAERDEYNAAIRVHVQTQILDNVHDGKTSYSGYGQSSNAGSSAICTDVSKPERITRSYQCADDNASRS